MKESLDGHASRFDEMASDYDNDHSPEYEAAVAAVVDKADPEPDDVVLDIGTGTGAIALALAPDASRVIGRDISEGMLDRAQEKATDRGLSTVSFGIGRFRDPNLDETTVAGGIDIVTSNFAMHHLADDEKREAIAVLADLDPRRIVLGDVMLFGEADPTAPFYDPSVDDPATVGVLADAFTDVGYALVDVERIHEQVGVLVAEARRVP